MAIGDKKPVVMESDKGVAGGVATLGADGILSEAERPFADQLYLPGGTSTVDTALQDKADLTLSNLTDQEAALQNLGLTATAAEINHLSGVTSSVQEQLDGKANLLLSNLSDKPNAIANLGAAVRPNLLDNAHFYSPHLIDQRQGYVVPPDTTYYSDTGLATSAGTVSAYTTAVYVNTTYGTITVDSVTYYVAWSAAVRGYAGHWGYTVDRWFTGQNSLHMLIKEECVLMGGTGGTSDSHYQRLENPSQFAGKTLTASMLVKGSAGEMAALALYDGTTAHGRTAETLTGDIQLVSRTITVPDTVPTRLDLFIYPSFKTIGAEMEVYAAKLEIGDTQTLARQLEDGSWEIIDTPPKPAEALAECQRYQVELNYRKKSNAVFGHGWTYWGKNNQIVGFANIPVSLRANPTVSWKGSIRLLDDMTGEVFVVTDISTSATNDSETEICLIVSVDGTLTAEHSYRLSANHDATASLFLDANS